MTREEQIIEMLTKTVGAAMAKKLVMEAEAAGKKFGEQLHELIRKCHDERMSLTKDDLCELRYNLYREQTVSFIEAYLVRGIVCDLLNEAASICIDAGDRVSDWVFHTATHYETAMIQKAGEVLHGATSRGDIPIPDEVLSKIRHSRGPSN